MPIHRSRDERYASILFLGEHLELSMFLDLHPNREIGDACKQNDSVLLEPPPMNKDFVVVMKIPNGETRFVYRCFHVPTLSRTLGVTGGVLPEHRVPVDATSLQMLLAVTRMPEEPHDFDLATALQEIPADRFNVRQGSLDNLEDMTLEQLAQAFNWDDSDAALEEAARSPPHSRRRR